MRRLFVALFSLAAVIVPAGAQTLTGGSTTRIVARADCTTGVTCNALSPLFCQQPTILFMCNTSLGLYTSVASGGGGGSPGGSPTQVQLNDGGVFGGDAGLTYDKATDFLTVAGGMKTPMKIGTDWTVANPVAAPTAVASSTNGSCTTGANSPRRFYTAYANKAGITNLSPASTDTAGVFLKGVDVTIPASVPSGADGTLVYWSSTSDGHGSKKRCAAGSADSLLISPGTTTYFCACNSGTAHGGSNETGVKAKASIDVVGDNIVGFGSVGSTIGSVTENVRRLRATGSTLEYSSDSGATYGALQSPVRVISICATGCQYTTIQAAVDANTSTASLPILYVVGPGVYSSGQTNMDGEDHAVFWGAGASATIINCTESGAPADGCIEPGTATNWTFTGFTVNGKINASMASTGGGIIRIFENEFIAPYTLGSHDGIYWDQPVAGSKIHVYDNTFDLTYNADGIACDRLCSNADWYIENNTFLSRDPRGSQIGIRFNSVPCNAVLKDNIMHFDGGASSAQALALHGYDFESDYGGSGDCSGTARIFLKDSQTYINNTAVNQTGSSSVFVYVLSTATALDELHISGAKALIRATDTNDTDTGGVINAATSGASVIVSTSDIVAAGGSSNTGVLTYGGPISIFDTSCSSESDLVGGKITGEHCATLATAPSVCNVGDHYTDTSGADCACTAANTWTNTTNVGTCDVPNPPAQACAVLTDLAAADDNFEFWQANQAVTITSVGCRCRGTCTGTATLTLEDRAGNAMTITGTNPTCATTGNATYAAVTAGNGLVAGEGIAFDTTNTPNPETDEYTICVTYTVP